MKVEGGFLGPVTHNKSIPGFGCPQGDPRTMVSRAIRIQTGVQPTWSSLPAASLLSPQSPRQFIYFWWCSGSQPAVPGDRLITRIKLGAPLCKSSRELALFLQWGCSGLLGDGRGRVQLLSEAPWSRFLTWGKDASSPALQPALCVVTYRHSRKGSTPAFYTSVSFFSSGLQHLSHCHPGFKELINTCCSRTVFRLSN